MEPRNRADRRELRERLQRQQHQPHRRKARNPNMRHKKVEKRLVEEDKVYQSALVSKFINRMMKDGKKTVAEKTFYNSFELLRKDGDPLVLFEAAINNVGPKI